MMSMLKLESVAYSYTGKGMRVDALKGITCGFEPAQFYAIMGSSGSGKSTLLHLINAMDKPLKGAIYYEGKDINTLSGDLYRRSMVAMVYQDFCLMPFMTVLENVMLTGKLNGLSLKEAKSDAMEKLSKVGIPADYYNRLPHSLSGGEQQRVAIARCLTSKAKVILADEPTGNLDSENSQNIVDLFSKLSHDEKRTVILVTHDPTVAQCADVVLTLKDGLLADG